MRAVRTSSLNGFCGPGLKNADSTPPKLLTWRMISRYLRGSRVMGQFELLQSIRYDKDHGNDDCEDEEPPKPLSARFRADANSEHENTRYEHY